MERIERENDPGQINFEIIVRTKAERETVAAFVWYGEQSAELGFEFLLLLDENLQFISRNPTAYQIVHKNIRRSLLRKFPYALFYIVEQNRIVILGCLHQRSNLREWTQSKPE